MIYFLNNIILEYKILSRLIHTNLQTSCNKGFEYFELDLSGFTEVIISESLDCEASNFPTQLVFLFYW